MKLPVPEYILSLKPYVAGKPLEELKIHMRKLRLGHGTFDIDETSDMTGSSILRLCCFPTQDVGPGTLQREADDSAFLLSSILG